MKKISIASGSQYQEQLQAFKDSKLFKRLNEKFRVKPYYEQNRHLKIVSQLSSYLFNILSILISFFFAYSLLNSFLGLILGALMAFCMLIVLECFKRLILPVLFKHYFQFRKLSNSRAIIVIGLIGLSAFFSYQGGRTAVHQFTSKVHQVDTDTIRNYYSTLIGSKQEQQKQLYKVKYKGTTTKTAQRGINALQTEINSIRNQENQLFLTSLEKNKELITNDNDKKYLHSFYFSLLALFFDLSLIICIGYSEYYDYTSLAEFGTLEDTDTATVPTLGGGAKELKNKEVTNDSKTIATAKKNCLNCQAVFDVSNPKKVYCSTTCRVKHWNSKHQKKLTVPTT